MSGSAFDDARIKALAQQLPQVTPPRDAAVRLMYAVRTAAAPRERGPSLGWFGLGVALFATAAMAAAGVAVMHASDARDGDRVPVAREIAVPNLPVESLASEAPIASDPGPVAAPASTPPVAPVAPARPRSVAARSRVVTPLIPADALPEIVPRPAEPAPAEAAPAIETPPIPSALAHKHATDDPLAAVEVLADPTSGDLDVALEARYLDGWKALKSGAYEAAVIAFSDVVERGGPRALAEEASYYEAVALVRAGSLARAEDVATRHLHRWSSGVRVGDIALLIGLQHEGDSARPWLERAATNGNARVRARAQRLLAGQ